MGVDRHRAGWADAPESLPTPLALTCDMCLSCGLEKDLACPPQGPSIREGPESCGPSGLAPSFPVEVPGMGHAFP